jgi:galactonate dehydratase
MRREGNVPLIRSFGRMLIGQDPLNIEAAFERIRTAGIFAGAQSGQYVTALTGVEIALWDIAGKALGLPVYQLLGGKVRDRVRVYCDSGAREMTPGDEALQGADQGDPGSGLHRRQDRYRRRRDPARFDRVNWTANNGEIDHMVAKVAFTRELYPKNIDLAVDMHGRYDATTGKRVAKELETVQADVAGGAGAAGEHRRHARHARLHQHAHLLRREHFHAARVPRDSREARRRHHHAGLPEVRRPAGSAQDRRHGAHLLRAGGAARRDFAHRHDGHAHVRAAIPNFLVQEWHWIDSPALWRNWVKEGEIIEKGFITLPERAGIGVEMNDDGARKAQVPGTPWFELCVGSNRGKVPVYGPPFSTGLFHDVEAPQQGHTVTVDVKDATAGLTRAGVAFSVVPFAELQRDSIPALRHGHSVGKMSPTLACVQRHVRCV